MEISIFTRFIAALDDELITRGRCNRKRVFCSDWSYSILLALPYYRLLWAAWCVAFFRISCVLPPTHVIWTGV